MPLFIIRTCRQRPGAFERYKSAIPGLIECFDDLDKTIYCNTSMLNIRKALRIAFDTKSSAVFLEDDILLCENFYHKVLGEINNHAGDVIQFFSMRKEDLTIGSRYIAGYKYLMNQCVYLPLEVIEKILDCFDDFENIRTDNKIGGTDSLIAFTLKKYKLNYWNAVPNLVDHLIGTSAIDRRRSSKRQSLTFDGKNL